MGVWKSKLRVTALVIIVLAVLAALFAWKSKAEANHAQALRDASYRQALSRFQRDLQLGMHREEVYKYFRSRSVDYFESYMDALVDAGEDPGEFPCARMDVYVAFHFDVLPRQSSRSPLDNLSNISIEKRCEK